MPLATSCGNGPALYAQQSRHKFNQVIEANRVIEVDQVIEVTMAQHISETSTAITHGIRVDVRCRYSQSLSRPLQERYTFAYRVRIRNDSNVPVQLLSRRWVITDANGKVKEITGGGVVGEQPIIQPGESFSYESNTLLMTSNGVMRGSYTMHSVTGRTFDAEVAPFLLTLPYSLN